MISRLNKIVIYAYKYIHVDAKHCFIKFCTNLHIFAYFKLNF